MAPVTTSQRKVTYGELASWPDDGRGGLVIVSPAGRGETFQSSALRDFSCQVDLLFPWDRPNRQFPGPA